MKIVSILSLAVAGSLLLTSCEKTELPVNPGSSFVVLHASPGSPGVEVYVDTARNTTSPFAYTASSPFFSTDPGTKKLGIRAGAVAPATQPTLEVASVEGFNFANQRAYTFLVYDTLNTTASNRLRVLRLSDDLTIPTGINTHVRFIHAAPNAPAVDVTLVRTSATPVDSVTIRNASYIGTAPNETALSAFTPIPGGTAYTARVKAAGTQTVVASFSLGTTLTSSRIVTLYATGTARGQALTVGNFRHY